MIYASYISTKYHSATDRFLKRKKTKEKGRK